jgi:hypothetical protein
MFIAEKPCTLRILKLKWLIWWRTTNNIEKQVLLLKTLSLFLEVPVLNPLFWSSSQNKLLSLTQLDNCICKKWFKSLLYTFTEITSSITSTEFRLCYTLVYFTLSLTRLPKHINIWYIYYYSEKISDDPKQLKQILSKFCGYSSKRLSWKSISRCLSKNSLVILFSWHF